MIFSSLDKKIFTAMLLMLISIMMVGSIALYAISNVNHKTVKIINKYTESIELLYNMRHLTEEVLFINIKMEEETDSSLVNEDKKRMERVKQELNQNFYKFEEVHGKASTDLYEQFYKEWELYLSLQEKEHETTDNAYPLRRQIRNQYDTAQSSLNKLLNFEKLALEKLTDEQKESYSTATNIIWSFLVLVQFLTKSCSLKPIS